MYLPTQAQLDTKARLETAGFRFRLWLPHQPDADGAPVKGTEHLGAMLMVRRNSRLGNEFREVEPDGSAN